MKRQAPELGPPGRVEDICGPRTSVSRWSPCRPWCSSSFRTKPDLSFSYLWIRPCRSFSLRFLCGLQVRDVGQEPCGRLSFLKEPKTSKGVPQTAVCNLNITLPTQKKVRPPCLNIPLFQPYRGLGMEMSQNRVLTSALGSVSEMAACCLCLLIESVPVTRLCLFHVPGSLCVSKPALEDV